MADMYRTARESDGAACAAIVLDWVDTTAWMPNPDDRASVEAFWTVAFNEEKSSWVAERDGRVIGFCVRNAGEENNIGALYVARQARRSGVGRRLLDLAKADCSHITVWAWEANGSARRFYRREGLVELSRELDEETGLMDVEHVWRRTA